MGNIKYMNRYSDYDREPMTRTPDIREVQAEQERILRMHLGDELYEWLEKVIDGISQD